jgi:hypothetical protein
MSSLTRSAGTPATLATTEPEIRAATRPASQASATSGRPHRTRGRAGGAGGVPGMPATSRRLPGGRRRDSHGGTAPVDQPPAVGDAEPSGVGDAQIVPGRVGFDALVEPDRSGPVVVAERRRRDSVAVRSSTTTNGEWRVHGGGQHTGALFAQRAFSRPALAKMPSAVTDLSDCLCEGHLQRTPAPHTGQGAFLLPSLPVVARRCPSLPVVARRRLP